MTGIAAALGGALAHAQDPTCTEVINGTSAFPVSVDGRFSGGLTADSHQPIGEWSDIVPQAFRFDAAGGLFRTCLSDPALDTVVYTAIAPGAEGGGEQGEVAALYLMYDFLRMTNPAFQPGQTIATVEFPITVNRGGGGEQTAAAASQQVNLAVSFVQGQESVQVLVTGDLNGDGTVGADETDVPAERIGVEGALHFGRSPSGPDADHGLAELEVPLRIPRNFGTGFPGSGINPDTGLYDPDPKFWSSSFKADPSDPDPAGSLSLVTIHPDGSVTSDSSTVAFAARGAKQSVLDELAALRPSIRDRRKGLKLDEALVALRASIHRKLYTDIARPRPRVGELVFELEELAVDKLLELLKKPAPSTDVSAVVEAAIETLVAVDREFAETAIGDAASVDPSDPKIARAQAQVDKGDQDASAGGALQAIEHYERAWELLTHAAHRGD